MARTRGRRGGRKHRNRTQPGTQHARAHAAQPTRNAATGGGGGGGPYTQRHDEAVTSVIARDRLAALLGQQYGGERDLYKTLGYIVDPVWSDYWLRYLRQDMARRVVVEPVNSTWRHHPVVSEAENEEDATEFDQRFAELADQSRLYHYLSRADRLAGVGQYAVLFLGFDDAQPMEEPVRNPSTLNFLAPYTQANAKINKWVTDEKDPRFGMPAEYSIEFGGHDQLLQGRTQLGRRREVHWSRVLHVPSDGLDESDVFGTPRMKGVLNRLMDLEKVVGGGAEMFWRGAFPGLVFNADADAQVDEESLEAEVQQYVHEMRRYMQVQGVDTKELSPQVADPTGHVSAIADLISAHTGIPKRKLFGSERGEMASGQDETNWNNVIGERRANHVNPVLHHLVERLIQTGVLPGPARRPKIKWPGVSDLSPQAQAQVARDKAQAIAAYVNAVGAPQVVPRNVFLRDVLNLDDDTVKAVEALLGQMEAADRLDELGEGDDDESSRQGGRGAAADQQDSADVARS